MLFYGIFLLLASLVSASKEAKKCSRALEGVVYVPHLWAYEYLHRITETLRAQSPLLWTDQAEGVIKTFENTYGVVVGVVDAFGMVYDYPKGNIVAPASVSKTNLIARAYALGEGYGSFDGGIVPQAPPVYSYASKFWNPNGEMYVVSVNLPKVNGISV